MTPALRMPSIRSERSKHSLDSSFSQILPPRTSTLGRPQMMRLARMLANESALSML